jgi:predicted acetyltransferase
MDHAAAPPDPVSAAALEARGLRLGLVDTADRGAFATWLRADHRGFHMGEPSDEVMSASLDGLAYRRTTGVWDAAAHDPASPVATVNSWDSSMTLPGARQVSAWAISSVTVAPTHRRKGIARALLEAELRTAAGMGIPLATLTVSESTIYGRFGFAPAAFASELTIDKRRVSWTGPSAPGRVQFISIPGFRAGIAGLHDRIRSTGVGQLDAWDLRWDHTAGIVTEDKERSRSLRAVRYDDGDGVLRGLALYRVTGGDADYAAHTLIVEHLATETDDAYAALWRYLLEVDLVSTITARDRRIDEPLVWQVSDMRGIREVLVDHLWTRILDVPAALEARGYGAPLNTVIDITDDLGFAAGRFSLTIDSGTAVVTSTDAPAALALSVNELSAIYLGGVSASALVAAGRIDEREPGSAAALDAAFHSPVAPWLSIWF